MKPTTLALFDFDGTITSRDTLAAFVIYYHGKSRYYQGLVALSPVLSLFKLGLIPNWKAKEIFISHFFKGIDSEVFQEKCDQFVQEVMPGLIRSKAMERIKAYRQQRADIWVVSASPTNWVSSWAEQQGFKSIGTLLEVKNGRLTGKIAGKNCYGPEKVDRIKKAMDLTDYEEIHVYGDSKGDKEMLALGSVKYFKPFRS